MVVSMRHMGVNQKGCIRAVTASGEMGRRLRDMGLVVGTTFMIIGHAPLQDPVAVRLRGCTLSLRNREADCLAAEAL